MFTFLPVFIHEFRHNVQVKRYVGNQRITLYQKFRGLALPIMVRAFEITERLTLAATLKNFNLNKKSVLILPTYLVSYVKNFAFVMINLLVLSGVVLYGFIF